MTRKVGKTPSLPRRDSLESANTIHRSCLVITAVVTEDRTLELSVDSQEDPIWRGRGKERVRWREQ